MAKQTAWGNLLWDWHVAVQEHERLCPFSQNAVFFGDCLLALPSSGGWQFVPLCLLCSPATPDGVDVRCSHAALELSQRGRNISFSS